MNFAVDEGVGFLEDLPAFAVADDHELAADIDEHGRADFTGERAFVLGVAVLGAERDGASLYDLGDARQKRKWRANGDIDARLAAQPLDNARCQHFSADAARVHFPVAGDEFFAHRQIPRFCAPLRYARVPQHASRGRHLGGACTNWGYWPTAGAWSIGNE